jgi:hypothetical protein
MLSLPGMKTAPYANERNGKCPVPGQIFPLFGSRADTATSVVMHFWDDTVNQVDNEEGNLD